MENSQHEEIRMGKGSIYAKTLAFTLRGQELLEKADEMSLRSDQLARALLQSSPNYSSPDERTKNLDICIIDWFMENDLTLCDAYSVLDETVRWMVSNPAARPSPAITERIQRVNGDQEFPSRLATGAGIGQDPWTERISSARVGVTGKLESTEETWPYVEALIQLFRSRQLTVREALGVIAMVESGLLNAPVV